jgi:hypothetical protein
MTSSSLSTGQRFANVPDLGFWGLTVIPLGEGRNPRRIAETNLSIPCELDGVRSVVMLSGQDHESRLLAGRELSRNALLGVADRCDWDDLEPASAGWGGPTQRTTAGFQKLCDY